MAISSKVTATDVAVAQLLLEVVVVEELPVVLVLVVVAVPVLEVVEDDPVLVPVGNEVEVTDEYVPVADEELHKLGTVFALGSPHEAGTTLLRRAYAVKNAA